MGTWRYVDSFTRKEFIKMDSMDASFLKWPRIGNFIQFVNLLNLISSARFQKFALIMSNISMLTKYCVPK